VIGDAQREAVVSRYSHLWDQSLTLLSFETGAMPPAKREKELREDEEGLGLQELDGKLRWPSKKRRR
jgi:hypothetical protein